MLSSGVHGSSNAAIGRREPFLGGGVCSRRRSGWCGLPGRSMTTVPQRFPERQERVTARCSPSLSLRRSSTCLHRAHLHAVWPGVGSPSRGLPLIRFADSSGSSDSEESCTRTVGTSTSILAFSMWMRQRRLGLFVRRNVVLFGPPY